MRTVFFDSNGRYGCISISGQNLLFDHLACHRPWPGQKVHPASEPEITRTRTNQKHWTSDLKSPCLTKSIILIFLRNQKLKKLKLQNICLILRRHHRMQKCLTARKKPSQDNKMYIFPYYDDIVSEM